MVNNVTEITAFTAYHVDPTDPTRVAFAAVYHVSGLNKARQFTFTATGSSYMQSWMQGVAALLAELEMFTHGGVEALQITIHMCHPNIQSVALKLNSVYRDLAPFVDDVTALMNVKLRKKNKQRYEHHDAQVSILSTVLGINKRLPTKLKFKPLSSKVGSMPTAYQLAITAYQAAFE